MSLSIKLNYERKKQYQNYKSQYNKMNEQYEMVTWLFPGLLHLMLFLFFFYE